MHLGQLADLPHPDNGGITQKVDEIKEAFQAGKLSREQFIMLRERITGVPSANGEERDELIDALTSLMGDHIPLESRTDGGEGFVPSPPWLKYLRPKQLLAMQDLLCRKVLSLTMMGKNVDGVQVFGRGNANASYEDNMIVISPGLLAMANSFWQGTLGNPTGMTAKEGTPEEVVAYIKKRQNERGVTWDQTNMECGSMFHPYIVVRFFQLGLLGLHWAWVLACDTLGGPISSLILLMRHGKLHRVGTTRTTGFHFANLFVSGK